MGFLVSPSAVVATPGMWRASAIFSTMLGAIVVKVTILIRRVDGPDERVVV
jgi:hypothetical protein